MAAKTWEEDFRYPAIRASIRAMEESAAADPFAHPGSLCLPVAERPLVGWTPGRVTLLALVLGFALLGMGAWLASVAEKQGAGAGLLALAACCTLSGFLMFFVPLKLDRQLIGWMMGRRGRELVERACTSQLMASELSNPATAHKISIDGDDHVLILFDDDHQRLLIEGLGARYQIRAADVRLVAPYSLMNYVGVQITYAVNAKALLSVAIARVSLTTELARQLPFLFFLRKTVSNKLLERSVQALNRSEVDEPDAT